MKILLTGKPGVGKSTVIEKVRQNFQGEKYGIVAREIRDESANRVGFESVNMDGDTSLFAHTKEIKSDTVIGGKYYVDIKAIDSFVVNELNKGLNDSNSLVFIDEIGRMQSYSDLFMQTVKKVLVSESNILATIVYDPEPWSLEFKNHPDVILVEVKKDNRELLPDLLKSIFNSSEDLGKLSSSQKKVVNRMLQKYFDNQSWMQIGKLVNNSIGYVVGHKIKSLGQSKYHVSGKTKPHELVVSKENVTCDCDLFNGRNEYQNNSGVCSHILAVNIYDAHTDE